jgi:hypothetical protein
VCYLQKEGTMIIEVITASFVTQTALITAKFEGRFYRWTEPHRGIFLLFFVFVALFSVGYFIIDFINPIAGYSGVREVGFNLYRLSEVFGTQERVFITLIFTCFYRFHDLYTNKWKLLFLEEEGFNCAIYFGLLYVIVEISWCLLWVVDLFWL